MRKLFLMRHGKAEDLKDKDRNRKLTPYGIESAKKIGAFITEFKRPPEIIFCSPAARTLQSAEIIQNEMDKKGIIPALEVEDKLYNFNLHGKDIISYLASLGNEYLSTMIVGHNPSIEQILWDFLRERIVMSTASLAVLKFDIENWKELEKHTTDDLKVKLFSYKSPKEL